MKERSRERMAELLLEELFAQAGEREDLKRMLGDLTVLPLDEVIHGLVDDLTAAVARRRLEAQDRLQPHIPAPSSSAPVPVPAAPPADPPAPPPEPEPPRPTAPVVVDPPAPEAARAEPVPPSDPAPLPPAGEEPAAPLPAATSAPAEAFWGDLEAELRSGSLPREEPEADEEGEFEGTLREADVGARHTATEFTDSDVVYLHGVGMIPEAETPSPHPFMLEEKGIDGRSFAFAVDYEGLRFYLSRIVPTGMNVSKTGMLLLGKQESLEARANHESVLNDLRLHGVLLPFAFGTLARGRDGFLTMVDGARQELVEAVEEILATRWWVVRLHALDARIVQIVGKEETAPSRKGRTVERTSYTKMPMPKKYDIKVLERILNKEKRLAESVHEELKNVAERSDIDMIVGLGSGSSEDWKLILEASYELRPGTLQKFFHAIADLQYRHITLDLMFAVAGDREPFSFADR